MRLTRTFVITPGKQSKKLFRAVTETASFRVGMRSVYSSFFLLVPPQNSQDLEKSTCRCDSKADEARRGPKELLTDISALCPLRDPREDYPRQRGVNY